MLTIGRSRVSLVIALSAGLAPAAFGQLFLSNVTRTVTATPGDGSAEAQIILNDVADFNHSVSRVFPLGSCSASQVSTSTAWHLTNSMTATSQAQSHAAAGSGRSSYAVTFYSAIDFDMDLSVSTSAGPNGQGTSIFTIYDNQTNQLVYSGDGSHTGHFAAGHYSIYQSVLVTWGSFTTTMDLSVRPGNDSCAHALDAYNGSTPGDTTAASPDGTASCGSSNASPSLWYRYTSPGTGPLVATTCWSSYDTVLTAYDPFGGCPLQQSDQLACSDDTPAGAPYPCDGTLQSSLTVNVFTGQIIYFRVSGYNGAAGHFYLNLGPINDSIWSPSEIAMGDTIDFDNRLATTDGPALNSCSNGGQDTQVNGDLWWLVYVPANGTLSADTCGSTFDTKLAVYRYTGNPANPVYQACNDDACGYQSRIDNLAVAGGNWYYLRVGGYRGARGTGSLHVAFTSACPADFNGDGFLDFFDYDDYVSCFETATCPPGKTADFNQDGFADFFDYDDFVSAFEAGC